MTRGKVAAPAFAALWYVLTTTGALAQTENTAAAADPGEGIDCAEISVEYEYDPALTSEENLAAMDAAFYASLSKFDYCATANRSAATGGGSAGGSGSGADGGDSATGGLEGDLTGTESGSDGLGDFASAPSSEASDLTGTEPVAADRPATLEDVEEELAKSAAEGDDQPSTLDNGAVPEDIPSADNDSVLEAQIRKAAMEETDPEVRQRLWDEYRKYKGLPTKNAGEQGS